MFARSINVDDFRKYMYMHNFFFRIRSVTKYLLKQKNNFARIKLILTKLGAFRGTHT